MRNYQIPGLMLCIVLASNNCGKSPERTAEAPAISGDIIRIDVNASVEEYPEKGWFEFENKNVSMKLVPLETNDEFLCAGGQVEAFTDSVIIYHNYGNDEILIFDGQGKALKKLSRGESGKEYKIAFGVVYDDRSKELFVNDTYSRRIKVFSLDGEFKRALPYPSEPAISVYNEMLNYDNESLICYTNDNIENPVFLISKQTGEKLQDIIIPYGKRISVDVFPDGTTMNMPWGALSKTSDGIIISEPSSDTIYHLSRENRVLRPILCRTPSIQTMNVPVFITPYKSLVESMWVVLILRKEQTNNFFGGLFIHDYKNGKIYKLAKRSGLPIRHYNPADFVMHETRDNVFLLPELFDDLKEEDGLTGEEQEIVSRLKEDDNPVMAIFTIQERTKN